MPTLDLTKYQTLVFDCDGVILNSNNIKTQAFFDVARVYGHDVAQQFKDYHLKNAGLSRYVKFQHLFNNILKKSIIDTELENLLHSFSTEIKGALLTCEVAEGLAKLRDSLDSNWLVVSASDQKELRDILYERNISDYFNGGVFGSPDNKDYIMHRERENGNITSDTLFIGDSMSDYQCAKNSGSDFIFLNKWTGLINWREFFVLNCYRDIDELLEYT